MHLWVFCFYLKDPAALIWWKRNCYLCKNNTTARGSPLNTSPCFKIYYNLAYRKGVVCMYVNLYLNTGNHQLSLS